MKTEFSYLVLLIHIILGKNVEFSCKNDEDCNEGYSCHNNKCVLCISCGVILRKGSACVVDFNKCGECLEGFEEVPVTDSSSAIKPCKPVRLKHKSAEHHCASDDVCPPSNYCHKQSCVKCFNCSIVNRLSPVEKCAKELNDCGDCVNGFEEVAVTADTKFKLCEKKIVTAGATVKRSCFNIYYIIACLLLYTAFAVISVIFFRKRYLERILRKSQCLMIPSAPPLCSIDPPQQILKLEEGSFDMTPTIEQKQQAKVFKKPDAPYYFTGERTTNRNDSSRTSGESSAMTEVSSPNNRREEERGTPSSSLIFIYNSVAMNFGISTTDSHTVNAEDEPGTRRIILSAIEVDQDQNANAPPRGNTSDSFPETIHSQQENSCDDSP